jgi:hypothetical protein
LLAQRSAAEERVRKARTAEQEIVELLRYVQEKEEPGVDWLEQYRHQDALGLLERLRLSSGLSRSDLILRERIEAGPFLRTRYFMTLQGPYPRQLQFLQALEHALPLVVVDSFVLEGLAGSADTVLKLNATVLTLGAEGGA